MTLSLVLQVNSARAWRERTARVFLKKNSHHSLLDILSPRMDISGNSEAKKKKRLSAGGKDEAQNHPLFAALTPEELSDPQAIVRAFSEAEKNELQVSLLPPLKTCRAAAPPLGLNTIKHLQAIKICQHLIDLYSRWTIWYLNIINV